MPKQETPGPFKSEAEFQEHLENEDLEASRLAAESFLVELLSMHSSDPWVLEGLVLTFDLFSRQRNLANARQLASDLQNVSWKWTTHYDRSFNAFVSGVRRREGWLPEMV